MKRYTLYLVLLVLLFCSCQSTPTEQTPDSSIDNPNIQRNNAIEEEISKREAQKQLKALSEETARELREEGLDDEINTSVINLQKFKHDPYAYKHLKRLKSVTSYPDFFRKFFKTGSSTKDLIAVQGEPDTKVSLTNSKEAWYYGDCEVIISHNVVEDVRKEKDCLSFF